MLLCVALFLTAVSSAAAIPEADEQVSPNKKCARPLTHSPAPGDFAKEVELKLPGDLMLSGNDMGIQGHKTTLTQCSVKEASGAFGWTWTRGTTERKCSTVCPYNIGEYCYYQFGFHKIQYGINPWGISSASSRASQMQLPALSTNLESLDISLDVDYKWIDQKPVTQAPVYRSRLIYDFFLSNQKPVEKQMRPDTITDEIVIEVSHNADFELPCGYQPGANHSAVIPNVFTVDGEVYDLMDYTDQDKPCSNCKYPVRMTRFRRQGSICNGNGHATCTVPKEFDLMPFINKALQFKPESRSRKAGAWIGAISLGTEIYDNQQGSVMFRKFEVKPTASRGVELISI